MLLAERGFCAAKHRPGDGPIVAGRVGGGPSGVAGSQDLREGR